MTDFIAKMETALKPVLDIFTKYALYFALGFAVLVLVALILLIALLVTSGKSKKAVKNSLTAGNAEKTAILSKLDEKTAEANNLNEINRQLNEEIDTLKEEAEAHAETLKQRDRVIVDLSAQAEDAAQQSKAQQEEIESLKQALEEASAPAKRTKKAKAEQPAAEEKPAPKKSAKAKEVKTEDEPVKKPAKAKPAKEEKDDAPAKKPAKAKKAKETSLVEGATEEDIQEILDILKLDNTTFMDSDELIIENESTQTDDTDKGASDKVSFTLKYDRAKSSWIILKKGQDRPVRRVETKDEALKVAKELAKKYDANLKIHKKDGKFQKVR